MEASIRLKRGTIRHDGMVFWAYAPKCVNSEYWMSPEKFLKKKQSVKAYNSQDRIKEKQKAYLQSEQGKQKRKLYYSSEQAIKKRKAYEESQKGKMVRKSYYNSEKNKERKRAYRQTEARKEYDRAFRKRPETIAYQKAYQQTEKCIASRNRYHKSDERKAARRERRKTDLMYALTEKIRIRIFAAIKSGGYRKNSKTEQILGCDYETAKLHLESKFSDGMTWENQGKWHIDHIIPLASAQTEDRLLELCHYTNLQPLWAKDNLSKGDKLPHELTTTP
jgi:hypothetical protein